MFQHQKMKGSPPEKNTLLFYVYFALFAMLSYKKNGDLMPDKQSEWSAV